MRIGRINFRTREFNREIDNKIKDIYECCHRGYNNAFPRLLVELELELRHFYISNKKVDRRTEKSAINRSNEIFSEFLHNLVYYITHNTYEKQREFAQRKIFDLMEYKNKDSIPLFFYTSSPNEITLWIDEKTGYNVLHALAKVGFLTAVQAVLLMAKKTFDLEDFALFLTKDDRKGYSSLNFASAEGHVEIVELLLNTAQITFGQNIPELYNFITHEDSYGSSAFNSACRQGHIQVVRKLAATVMELYGRVFTARDIYQYLTQPNKNGNAPFFSACKAGHDEIVNELISIVLDGLKKGILDSQNIYKFLTQVNRDGFSPLNSACSAECSEVVQSFLYNLQVLLNIQLLTPEEFYNGLALPNKDRFTPLLSACIKGNSVIAKQLINAIARNFDNAKMCEFLTQRNKNGFSPLHAACNTNSIELVRILIDMAEHAFGHETAGFLEFINATNNNGFTAVNCAVLSKQQDIVLLLIETGADTSIKNKKGFSAADNMERHHYSHMKNDRGEKRKAESIASKGKEKKKVAEPKDDRSKKLKVSEYRYPFFEESTKKKAEPANSPDCNGQFL